MRAVLRWATAAAAVAFALLAYAYLTLPDVRPLAVEAPRTTAFMELRKREAAEAGRPLTIRHRWVPYHQMSDSLRRAVLVAEDAAFFEHDGIDLKELRASLELNWEEGRFTRGASTITQQLAKNLYLSPSRNPMRKFKELLITRRLEAALTKRRILEIYLNVIEWGDGIFGAEAAARTYFGKPASALTPDEAALLAAAIINPRVHNPASPTARLLRRQQIIARRMGVRRAPALAAVSSGGQVSQPTTAAESPQDEVTPAAIPAENESSLPPSPPAQTVQPPNGTGGLPPISPTTKSENDRARPPR